VPDKIVYVFSSVNYPNGDYLTSFKEWPQVNRQDIYLGANKALSWHSPAQAGRRLLGPSHGATTYGVSGSVTYTYDPSAPAPSYGGWLFKQTVNPHYQGCVDQSPLASRSDVLQFNSPALSEDLAICGSITATLTVSSNRNDTDFIARIVDQFPSGERFLVAEGIIRMMWRSKQLTPVAMVPGQSYEVEVDMWSACWIFAAGHSVGVDITSSSDFAYLPNPNTGLPLQPDGIWAFGGEYYTGANLTADNTIMFGPSRVSLPVVEKADLPPMAAIPLPIPSSELLQTDEELEAKGREILLQRNRR
jgi:putative CocE/NonD family hydrolase